MFRLPVILLAFLAMATPSPFSVARAERVPMSAKQLDENATHIVVGEVQHIYSRSEMVRGFRRTSIVAEVRISKVEKGAGLKSGELVYVRYWEQEWVGPGLMPPDTTGYRDTPKEREKVRIHLTRKGYNGFYDNTDGGFDVIGPNGFSRDKVDK